VIPSKRYSFSSDSPSSSSSISSIFLNKVIFSVLDFPNFSFSFWGSKLFSFFIFSSNFIFCCEDSTIFSFLFFISNFGSWEGGEVI